MSNKTLKISLFTGFILLSASSFTPSASADPSSEDTLTWLCAEKINTNPSTILDLINHKDAGERLAVFSEANSGSNDYKSSFYYYDKKNHNDVSFSTETNLEQSSLNFGGGLKSATYPIQYEGGSKSGNWSLVIESPVSNKTAPIPYHPAVYKRSQNASTKTSALACIPNQ